MPQIRFPLYLVTHKSLVDVSALKLARFVTDPKWLVSERFGGKCIEISTSNDVALGLITWTQDNPDEWWSLEVTREELVIFLDDLVVAGVQFAAFDSGTPQEASGTIEELLAKFRNPTASTDTVDPGTN